MSKTVAVLSSLLFAAVLLGGSGCHPTVSPAQRQDITVRMNGAQVPLAKCYSTLLAAKPDAKGTVSVAYRVQPNTGRFTGVKVVRSQIADPAFNTCVVGAISDLYVSPAPSFIIEVVEYPITFKPTATP